MQYTTQTLIIALRAPTHDVFEKQRSPEIQNEIQLFPQGFWPFGYAERSSLNHRLTTACRLVFFFFSPPRHLDNCHKNSKTGSYLLMVLSS
jgi:hypothetical protein